MFYYPSTYAVGYRDVIAAWLVCLAVVATGFTYAAIAAPDDSVADARAVPQAASQQYASRASPASVRS